MGSGNSKNKKVPEEEKKENLDKDKPKEITKDNQKEKEENKKVESKSKKEEILTNPIINQNNLQPSKDNTLSKQIPIQQNQNQNKNESQKIFENNAQLPSAIVPIKPINEGTSSIFPMSLNQDKKNKNEKEGGKNENIVKEEKPKLLKNEHLVAPMEGQLFQKTMTDNQLKNLENYNRNFYPKGEHIILSFGDCFDIFDDFFSTLFSEHQLYKEQPIYNYNTFFENDENDSFKARGIAFNIPNDCYDIYLKSEINRLYNNSNIIFNSMKKNKIDYNINSQNSMTIKQFLNMKEKSDDFIKEFNSNSNNQKLLNILSKEAEKCSHLHCLHFVGDIFDGGSMGILCNFMNEIQEDYRKVLKLAHLKYYDSLEHKAFNKIKNYIYTISNLYNKCDLVNFFNNSPKGGDILSCITIGERINEYSSGYSVNQILADLLVNPKLNFIYSNGIEVKEKDFDEKYIELLFQDCKEDKSHLYYRSQMSSLTIYKGNKIFGNNSKIQLSDEMSNIVDRYIKNNRSYYNFYDINKSFEINDFMANLHQSQYFVRYSEEFFMDFIQNYNKGNFQQEERQLREETINNVNGILNNFREIWRYPV